MCACQMARYGILVALAGAVQITPARADPTWAERLRSEGLPAWDAELANMVSVQGTERITRRINDGVTEFVVVLKANAECVMYMEKEGNEPTQVYTYNPRYTFRLRSTDDREWAVVSAHVGDPAKDSSAQNVRQRLSRYSLISGYGYRLPFNLEPLTRYVRGPTTRVVSVSPTTWKGIEGVEVKLDIKPTTEDDEVRSITSLHDTNQRWRTLRTSITGQRGESQFADVSEYEYTPEPGGVLRRISSRLTWKDRDGKTSQVETDRVFVFKRLTVLPDTSEFTLSAYGLPEPVGVEWPKRRSGWLWFAWAAAGCVVIATVFLILRHRAARRQTAVPATPS